MAKRDLPEVPQLETDEEFLKKCGPRLKELEDIRLKKLRSFERRRKLAIPLSAVLTPVLGFLDYWLLLLQRGNDDSAAGVTVIVLIALWAWVANPKREYAKAYKKEVLPEIAKLFGNFKYMLRGEIQMKYMQPSKIIPYHSSYKSEDCFSGEYRDVGIHFSEIKLKKQMGRNTVTVFDGIAILLSHGARKFYGHTIMIKNQGKIGEWFKKQTSDLKRANLVDPKFERLFDVYTNDQVEARYLIDPLMMEKLQALYREYNGNKMSVAFFENRVLILIGSSKNHFEPPVIEVPATNEAELLSMKHEIAQILAIVERLSLYDPRKRRKAEAEVAHTSNV